MLGLYMVYLWYVRLAYGKLNIKALLRLKISKIFIPLKKDEPLLYGEFML